MKTPLHLLAAISTLLAGGFMAFNAVLGLISRQLGLAEWHVGAIASAAALVLMFSSRAWGRASDRYGRMAIVRLGLLGFTVGFGLLSLFLIWVFSFQAARLPVALSITVLLVTRILIAVFFGATTTASQAYVADITTPQTRSAGMALLGLGGAVGMLLGPALASALAAWSLIASIVGAGLAGLLGWWLAQTRLPRDKPSEAIKQSTLSVTDPRIRFALYTAFSALCCVITAQIITGFFAQDRFGLSTNLAASLAGGALTAVGLALVLAQMLNRKLLWPPLTLIRTGAAIASLGFGSVMFVTSPFQMLCSYGVAGFGMGMVFPGFQALCANAVNPDEQGAAAGSSGAAQAFGMVLAPVVSSWLYRGVDIRAPYLLSGLLMATVCVLAFFQKPAQH